MNIKMRKGKNLLINLLNQKNSNLLIGIKINNYKDLLLIYDYFFLKKIKFSMYKEIYFFLKENEFANKYIKDISFFNIENKENILFCLITFDLLFKNLNKKEKAILSFIHALEKYISNHSIYIKFNQNDNKINSLEFFPLITISYACNNNDDDTYENVMLGFEELTEKKEKIICSNNLKKIRKKRTEEFLSVIAKINYALDNNGIISYFQPIIDNKTHKISKFESLVRLKDEKGIIYPPSYFLDIAKHAWIQEKITLKILENTFNFLKEFKIPISINISPSDIYRDFIKEEIFKLIHFFKKNEKNFAKDLITFEILEENGFFDKEVQDFIQEIKKNGVSIAIDDFGSGYSNFNRIIDSNSDIIKIDGSLIKNIDKEDTKKDLLRKITSFAKKRDKKIIAEFVSSENIFNVIKQLEVDYSQGFYFSPPLPKEKIKDFLLSV